MRSFTVEERRRRLGRRHGLVTKFPDVTSVAEAMVALHATDPATVYLSALARLAVPSLDAVASALYDDRSAARILAMRRTLFVAPVSYLAELERSSTDDVAANERKRLEGFLADSGIGDPAAWLSAAAAEVEAAMPDDGAQARAMTGLVPRLATKITMGAGTKWETTVGATGRVLAILANEGLLIRGRPAGEWTSRRHQWHLRDHWLGLATDQPMTHDEASAQLVRRWLTTFGPATFDDLKWWTGWKASQTRQALAALDVVEVDLDGGTGLVLADDLDDQAHGAEPDRWAALLPSLDPTPMGWKHRDWYLGPHRPRLFDRNGNIGPTIWVDGRIVGGWGQRPDGQIVTQLLEDVGADYEALIDEQTAILGAAIGDTVIKPSFPTPVQKELAC